MVSAPSATTDRVCAARATCTGHLRPRNRRDSDWDHAAGACGAAIEPPCDPATDGTVQVAPASQVSQRLCVPVNTAQTRWV